MNWGEVADVYPEWVWSGALFELKMAEKLEALRADFGANYNCGCGQNAWNLKYDEFMKQNLKMRMVDHSCMGCSLGEGIFEDGVHILVRVTYPRVGSAMIERYNRLRRCYPSACRHGICKILKLETGFLKMGATRITPYWREFCYWEVNYGYVPYKQVDALWPEIQDWLCNDLVLGGPLGEDNYLAMLYDEAHQFMASEWNVPRRLVTIKDWVKTGKWMEGHAGTGGKIVLNIDGKRVKAGSKPVDGVLLSDEDICRELITRVREEMHVMQKSETMKVRPVVKTGNAVNRKMNYLSCYLEDGLHGSRLSTLFAGEAGNELIDLDLVEAVARPSLLKVPLDQGGFDQHQSKRSIAAVLRAVGEYIGLMVPGSDFEPVWRALWDSLFVQGAEVICGEYRGEWENGLPSGWRWTAVLDTILNVCSFRVIEKLTRSRLFGSVYVGNFYAQGDDVIFTNIISLTIS